VGLRERPVLLLQLGEQPDVLDGDHNLFGERLQELDLPVGERPNLGPPDADRPDGLGPAEQRNGERCPVTVGPRKGTALGEFVNLGLQIGNVDRPPVEHCTSRGGSPYHRKHADRTRGDRALVSDEAKPVALDLEDPGIEGVAQTGGAPQHRREHGLDVGRRVGDDAQNLGGGGLLFSCLTQSARDLRI
jgi:hypothetical protein